MQFTFGCASALTALMASSAPPAPGVVNPNNKGPVASFRARAERAAKLDHETQAGLAGLRSDLGAFAKKYGLEASGDRLAVPLLDRMSGAHVHPTGEGLPPLEAEFGALEARAAALQASRHELDTLHLELKADLPTIARRLHQSAKTQTDAFDVPILADGAEALARQRRCDLVKIWFDGALNICVLVESGCKLSTTSSAGAQWLVSCSYECVDFQLATPTP
jgi:hypothetical protein